MVPLSIPTYAADGRLLRSYSPEAVDRLVALDKIVVQRGRRGQILCAQFRSVNGANPVQKSAHMGQRYSYRQQAGSRRVWAHRRLIQRQDVEQLMGEAIEDPQQIDLFIRGVFRAVPISVLKAAA